MKQEAKQIPLPAEVSIISLQNTTKQNKNEAKVD